MRTEEVFVSHDIDLASAVAPLVIAKAKELGVAEYLPHWQHFGDTLQALLCVELERNPLKYNPHTAICGDD